jgi:hypothetical protein
MIARAKDQGVKLAAFKADVAERIGIEQAQQLGGRALDPLLPVSPPGRSQEFANIPAAHQPHVQPGLAVLGTRHGDLLARPWGAARSATTTCPARLLAGLRGRRTPPPVGTALRGARGARARPLELAMLKYNCM